MPERYALFQIEKISSRFLVPAGVPSGVKRSYNISPTQMAPVVLSIGGVREIRRMKWGFIPQGAKNANSVFRYKTYEVKSEGIFDKSMWKHAIDSQRCLVPVDGFFEWKKTADQKQPFYIQPEGGEMSALGGVYSSWTDPDGVEHGTFAIVTVPANSDLGAIGQRMPVVLRDEDEAAWLDPTVRDLSSLYAIMKPRADGELVIQPANPAISSVKIDNEQLLSQPKTSP